MKIVVFGEVRPFRVGVHVDDAVIDLNRADPALPSELRALVELGQAGIDKTQKVIDHRDGLKDGAVVKATSIKLHAPWPGLRIACAGGNYAQHVAGARGGLSPTQAKASVDEYAKAIRDGGQWGFWKVVADAGGPDEDLPFPRSCTYFDFEGEVAIVLGQSVKDFKAGSRPIDELVYGITLLNDWSKRDGTRAQPRGLSYNLAKNFDGSTSLGPAIVVGELRCDDVPCRTHVNGELRQSYSTSEMVFAFAELLEHLSQDFTLLPGDIISGGTGSGTAVDTTPRPPEGQPRALDKFLKQGDVVEVSSPSIGVLRNRIV